MFIARCPGAGLEQPPFGKRVCVPLVVTGIHSDCVFVFCSAGGSRSLHETRANEDSHVVLVQTYLLGAPGRIIRRSWWPLFPFVKC